MKNNDSHPSHSRIAAAKILRDILLDKASLSQLTKYTAQLSTQDKAFAQALSYGSCRQFETLHGCISQLMHKPLKEKDYDLLALLIVGCYQLAYMRTPAHAAINSTVEASRLIGKKWASKMLNGILRNFQRQQDDLLAKLEDWQNVSHPQWFIAALQQDWPEQFESIIDCNNQQAPMCLRLAPELERQAYIQQLAALEINSQACEFSLQGVRLEQPLGVDQIPQFAEGLVSVQDEAAQLAAQLLDPQDGEYILDACAAPGGKSCHILERADVELLALEIDPLRCERIEENLERLNLQAAIQVADAADVDSWWDERSFDRILLDAPCSAMGVIRRHPDIKLLRRESDIEELSELQSNLLDQLWRTLKPGGTLLYATCSVLNKENEEQVAAFVARTADVKSLTIEGDWGLQLAHGKQLLPQVNGPDGFYYALLEKKYVD